MTALLDSACPCQSNTSYEDCCGRFHTHTQFPETAEQLMRSRYAAYVLKNVPYIVDTTVPSQQALLNVQAKFQSAVEFNAVFQGEEGEQTHHERSIFVKIDDRWYFVDPTVPLPTMKQPCVCGSGKKFKHCCGGFL